MVKVTVYIPTHNYGHYIDKAIESVLKQTMIDWELIVIDDGSTDNTRGIIRKFDNNSKVRIIEQENKGLNVTNNIALRLATGKYIMRLDADDYLDENALLVLSNILETKSEIGLVYPDYYHVNEDGEIIEIVRRKKIEEEVELLDLPAHGACAMIRKECLLNLEGYAEEFSCQDGYELWIKFIRIYKPYNVNVPLFYYRKHSNSLTQDKKKVLDTRRNIKSKYVTKYKNGKLPKVLGVVPAINNTIYPQSKPFVEIAGKPLLWYTLNELQYAKSLDMVVVSSEDEDVLEYAKQFSNIIPIKRPNELTSPGSMRYHIDTNILCELERIHNYKPDAICTLYINVPLRRASHIDKAVDTMVIFDVDTVISITEEIGNYYHHERFGLSPINKKGIRVERKAIYKENGAVYLNRVEVVRSCKDMGERVGHITMLPEESVKINTNYDFWLAKKLITEWRDCNNSKSNMPCLSNGESK